MKNIIWTFWNDGYIPPIVRKCLQSIHRHSQGFSVITLREKDLPQEIYKIFGGKYKLRLALNDGLEGTYAQHISDIVRIWALKEFGGIWIDISTYCNAPLNIPLNGDSEFYAEYAQHLTPEGFHETNLPFFLTCLMASEKNGEIVSKWLDECAFVWTFDHLREYTEYITKQGVNLDGINHRESYLWPCLALRNVLIKNPELVDKIETRCCDFPGGYFNLSYECGWDGNKMKQLYNKDKHPLIKLTNPDRDKHSTLELVCAAEEER